MRYPTRVYQSDQTSPLDPVSDCVLGDIHKQHNLLTIKGRDSIFLLTTDSHISSLDFAELGELVQACDAGCAFYIPCYHKDYPIEGKNLEHIGLASGKIATYLQYGLPIVVNEIGEMSRYVRQYGMGWVVDNVLDTGRVLAGLHRSDLEQSSKNAKQFFINFLNLDKTISPLLSIVSGLCNSVRGRVRLLSAAVDNKKPSALSVDCPSDSQAEFLEECIDPVLDQEYSNLESVIIDGGQHQTVSDGFKYATDEVMTWQNSDDTYHPASQQAVEKNYKNCGEAVRDYFQPVAGTVESFIDVQPIVLHPGLQSAYQALKDYTIDGFGVGLGAVMQIIHHIFVKKLHAALQWRDDLWHRTVVAQLTCNLVDRRSGRCFDEMDEVEAARFTQEFLAAEGAERTSYIYAYREKLLQGVDLGQPLYVSGAVLNCLGASLDPLAIFMIDGARRISAAALVHRKPITISLLILEEEYSEHLLARPSQDLLLKEIGQLAWFNNYQSIPLVGIRGLRSLNRFALMDMSLLRDQVVMDFGCNLGQACIKAVMAGAQEVWGVEGMPDTYRIAEDIGRLSGFSNLRYLNVDFNAPDFDRQIDDICPGQVDYTFFLSVYRTKELTQRDRLFRYIIQKTRKGIFFEGHADPKIDSLEYYDWLFESFGLTAQYLGNSEGDLRPLFFIPFAAGQVAPPSSPTSVPPKPQITTGQEAFRVSAIVSTYKSERLIEGRLRDLLGQTLGSALEIIVVDSNSPENERAIVERYMADHPNIVYIRTEQRETVYQAWNRGAAAARGKYLTNANTDDRLRPDALGLMADLLDENPEITLVYGDFFITNTENMEFYNHVRTGYSIKPDYKPEIMLHGCHMGPQPVWRKSLHEELGYFDTALHAAGDYDFWCRIACRYPMLHISEFLGLYLHNVNGICNSNVQRTSDEAALVKARFSCLLPHPLSDLPTGFYCKEIVQPGHYVNICMVTYNRLEFTRQALANILLRTDYPYVLTVVDNASCDGTQEYLQEQRRQGVIKNLVLLDENVGLAKATNLAWSLEPEAAYLMRVDNDIVMQRDGWLKDMVDVFEQTWQLGVLGYSLEPVSYPLVQLENGIALRVKNGNVGGGCMMISRRVFDTTGYLCEEYGLYGEDDADYGARVMVCGLLNAYMPDEDAAFHLPGGKAAIIDPLTLASYEGGEEELHAEYRAWKDTLRQKNVLSGHFSRNLQRYRTVAGAYHLGSRFVSEFWHRMGSGEAGSGRKESVDDDVLISIIIPVFNQVELTRVCLETILSEASKGVEIIVVDNGSNDGAKEYLRKLRGGISLIENHRNRGFARACNQGAVAAAGRYLVFLNNDTVPQPGWLDALLQPARAGEADIVGAKLLYPDATIQHAGVVFDQQGPLHCCKRMAADDPMANQPRYLQAVTAACMLISAELFQQLGGFDEGYKNGFEDIDLCLSAVQRGCRVYYQPASVLIHHEESSEGRKRYDEENYARFLRRWIGRWQIDHASFHAPVGIPGQA